MAETVAVRPSRIPETPDLHAPQPGWPTADPPLEISLADRRVQEILEQRARRLQPRREANAERPEVRSLRRPSDPEIDARPLSSGSCQPMAPVSGAGTEAACEKDSNRPGDLQGRLQRIGVCVEMLLEAQCWDGTAAEGAMTIRLDRLLGPNSATPGVPRGNLTVRCEGGGGIVVEKWSRNALSESEEESLLAHLTSRGIKARFGRSGGTTPEDRKR